MIQGKTFLYFSNVYFSDTWFSKQALAVEFAKHNKVFFINPPIHLLSRNADVKSKRMAGKLYKHSDNLVVYTPMMHWPIHRIAAMNAQFCAFIKKSIDRAIFSRFSIEEHPILWINSPIYLGLIGAWHESVSVWHLTDDYRALPQYQSASYAKLDAAVTRKVNVILAVSDTLARERRKVNPNTYVVHNGVALQDFLREAGASEPAVIASITHPRVGFLGSINRRIDSDLVGYLAEQFPETEFVFVGPKGRRLFSKEEYEKLLRHKNVCHLDACSHADVPRYLAAFDALIMPYRQDVFNEASDPLKLYEYLASGRPIVTTNLPAVRPFSKTLFVAGSKEEFATKLKEALAVSGDPARAEAERTLAREHDWSARAEYISSILLRHETV